MGFTLVFVGAMFAIGVGLAMIYWFILARWENRNGRVLDGQVIALYAFNPASAYFLYDWARRADKIAFPVWEVILPIAGFVLSWLVFRVVDAKSLPDAAQKDL
ncbi:MAG: hypothetical protein KIT02_09010 [Devosia sp.]|uniref:hypothetical protein n=1 Tax=Devosia sp. TaxID=1871048 RepID=UPI0024C521F9|nr:hypothetical protein [Devosia sp.]UYN98123.1 MAG: hypothetical protein KIT02_09010 [Devosia sp.]